MTVEEKELLINKCKILHKLGFERCGDVSELNYRRIIYCGDIIGIKDVGDVCGVIATVNLDNMKLQLHNWILEKSNPFENTHDIPKATMDNEMDFSEWIVKIIKEDTENANSAN